MKVAGIYKWATSKARGYELRQKYQIYIGHSHGRHVFLFINSENYYGEGYCVHKTDYPFFMKEKSYIGCTNIVTYSNDEVHNIPHDSFVGVLCNAHIDELIKHISQSEVMEPRHITFICDALKKRISC